MKSFKVTVCRFGYVVVMAESESDVDVIITNYKVGKLEAES